MQQIIRNAGKTVTITLPDELVGMDVRIVALPAEEYVPMAAEAGVVYGEVDTEAAQLSKLNDELEQTMVDGKTVAQTMALRREILELKLSILARDNHPTELIKWKNSLEQVYFAPETLRPFDEFLAELRKKYAIQ